MPCYAVTCISSGMEHMQNAVLTRYAYADTIYEALLYTTCKSSPLY